MSVGEKFGGENAVALNALHAAFERAAQDYDFADVYDWVEGAPKTSLTAELYKALRSLGYDIVKKE